ALGHHVDGAFQRENFRRTDISTAFTIAKETRHAVRTLPDVKTVAAAIRADAVSATAENRAALDKALAPLRAVYDSQDKANPEVVL
uniref:hypothetical protein n=1 Tax=Escherichia coli TaxID=562 RepID=UPI0013D0293E